MMWHERPENAGKMLTLASQKAVGKGIYGYGWLISEKKAAENVIVWELSEAERAAVRRISLNKKNG